MHSSIVEIKLQGRTEVINGGGHQKHLLQMHCVDFFVLFFVFLGLNHLRKTEVGKKISLGQNVLLEANNLHGCTGAWMWLICHHGSFCVCTSVRCIQYYGGCVSVIIEKEKQIFINHVTEGNLRWRTHNCTFIMILYDIIILQYLWYFLGDMPQNICRFKFYFSGYQVNLTWLKVDVWLNSTLY